MQLISIQRCPTADGRRGRYTVELSDANEESRKVLIARIEDLRSQSLVEFQGWSREWKTFYIPSMTEFRAKQVLHLTLSCPEDMEATGIGCFILSLII